jgi:hypothetical protein
MENEEVMLLLVIGKIAGIFSQGKPCQRKNTGESPERQ